MWQNWENIMKLMVAWSKRGSDEAGAEGQGLGAPVLWPGRVADPSRTIRHSEGGGAVGLCWTKKFLKMSKPNLQTPFPGKICLAAKIIRPNPTESDRRNFLNPRNGHPTASKNRKFCGIT
jgi:hypothetical protein